MSREQKITKLCRAVRAYRGAAHGKDKDGKTIWSIPPKPAERPRVQALLQALNLNVTAELELIDSLETIQEFRQWVDTLR